MTEQIIDQNSDNPTQIIEQLIAENRLDDALAALNLALTYIIHIPRGFARSFAMHMLWRQQIAAQEEVAL